MEPLERRSLPHLPGLDGLRALSIVLVLLDHWYLGSLKQYRYALLYTIFNGEAGVRIFFVISGFLISRIVMEGVAIGTFTFRDFYIKRIAKLFPVLFLYVATLATLNYLAGENIVWFDYLRALFFLTVHQKLTTVPALAHTWSLSVEEIFYVVLVPLAYALRKQLRILIVILCGLILSSFVFTAINWHLAHAAETKNLIIPILGDLGPIAIGTLLAIYARQNVQALTNLFMRRTNMILLTGLLLILFDLRAFHSLGYPKLADIFSFFFTSVGACFLVLYCLYSNPKTSMNKILNHPVAVGLGQASYSIYIVQQVFFWEPSHFHWTDHFKVLFSLPLSLALGLLVFKYIERPINRRIRAHFGV